MADGKAPLKLFLDLRHAIVGVVFETMTPATLMTQKAYETYSR